MIVNQYEIILVNLEQTLGSEIKKTRPCVVISPNEMNHYLRKILIAPITSTLKKYPTRIGMTYDNVKGMIAIDQIRTIDRKRAVKILGALTEKEIDQVKNVIQETFVD